jgi:hypothetical protein
MTKRAEELAEKYPHRKWIIDYHAMKVLFNYPKQEEMHECIIDVMPIEEHKAILAAASQDALNSEVVRELVEALENIYKVTEFNSHISNKCFGALKKYKERIK